MNEDIKKRLESLGYAVQDGDSWPIQFIWEKTEKEILIKTNQKKVPDDLYNAMVDAVCGAFLLQKKQMGLLGEAETALIVSKIKEGDTDVSFQEGVNPDSQFLSAVSSLSVIDKRLILKYRKLVFR